jgi:hypothetical protein
MCKTIIEASMEKRHEDPAIVEHDKESFTAFIGKFFISDAARMPDQFPRDSDEMVSMEAEIYIRI